MGVPTRLPPYKSVFNLYDKVINFGFFTPVLFDYSVSAAALLNCASVEFIGLASLSHVSHVLFFNQFLYVGFIVAHYFIVVNSFFEKS